MIGGIYASNETNLNKLTIENATCSDSVGEKISGWYNNGLKQEYDLSRFTDNITADNSETNIQVGIMGDESSQITFKSMFTYNLASVVSNIKSDNSYNTIQNFLNDLNSKATELGAASNRLESALDSIGVNIENLTSSRSTIKDADIAQVSSDYIRHQILQQAAATLLATANQSPAIALQLI